MSEVCIVVAYCIAAWARAYIRSAPTGTLNGRKTHGGTVTKQTGPKTKTADSKPARKGHLPQELLIMSRKNASRPGQSLTLSCLLSLFLFHTLFDISGIETQTRSPFLRQFLRKPGQPNTGWTEVTGHSHFSFFQYLVPKAINNNQRRAATKRPTPSYSISHLLAVGIPSVHSHLR